MIRTISAFLILSLLSVAFATPDVPGIPGIDFGAYGVDMAAIAAIMALTQVLKGFIPKRYVVLLPLGLALLAYFLTNGVNWENPILILYYAGAASMAFQAINRLTKGKVLKSASE